ncbi:hypothetical protein Goshw_000961 [Gossypium schwendimanii]|uniref:Uncharacterized protein n=1 Tax=Gossypium schwendimanii TaxID=34291 RepID=A0A7J9MFM3_GOSSC|nr:hypothetical protein [Gossypium schwendimanii]
MVCSKRLMSYRFFAMLRLL